ncbi:MAG: hypothetical protein KC912_18960 [Proteobacteria bacterium]|nr:hypothetical protein [Pseudomonadota bacterium]
MPQRPLIALVLASATLAGCPQQTTCTAEARVSVMVEVIDAAGDLVVDPVGTYTVDGGAEADCESWGDGMLACGWEVPGEFSITVDGFGFTPETVSATVTGDTCHVGTEDVTVTLEGVDCTDSIEASVLVTVTDGQGAQVTAGDVVWNMADEDDLPEACDSIGGNQWHCGYEVAGDIRIDISNAGPYEAYSQVVTVEEGECHVVTESLAAVLEYLPD